MVTIAFERRTQGGKTQTRKLRHYGKVIVFRDELDAVSFVADTWGDQFKYETRKATRDELLYGVPSSKVRAA